MKLPMGFSPSRTAALSGTSTCSSAQIMWGLSSDRVFVMRRPGMADHLLLSVRRQRDSSSDPARRLRGTRMLGGVPTYTEAWTPRPSDVSG